jgi:hypothetical protein
VIPHCRSRLDGGRRRDRRRHDRGSRVLESPRALRSRGSLRASRGRSLHSRPRFGACVAGVRGARSPFQSAEDGGRPNARNPRPRIERTARKGQPAPGARGRALVARTVVRGLSIAGRRPRSAGGWGGVRPSRCGAGRLRCCDSFLSAAVRSFSKPATETIPPKLTTETAVADRIARKTTDKPELGDHQP